jgi:hypothetical protein
VRRRWDCSWLPGGSRPVGRQGNLCILNKSTQPGGKAEEVEERRPAARTGPPEQQRHGAEEVRSTQLHPISL